MQSVVWPEWIIGILQHNTVSQFLLRNTFHMQFLRFLLFYGPWNHVLLIFHLFLDLMADVADKIAVIIVNSELAIVITDDLLLFAILLFSAIAELNRHQRLVLAVDVTFEIAFYLFVYIWMLLD